MARRLFSGRRTARRSTARTPRGLLLALVTFGAGALAAWLGLVPDRPAPPPPQGAPLPPVIAAPAAEVRVVDGDTLRLGAVTVRMLGLDAPERGQPCQRADGTTFDCGEAAARQMASLVQRRGVSCDVAGRDRYGRALGTCHADGIDLAEAMVSSGWAIAVDDGRRGQARYGVAEAQARSQRHGLWAGRFATPDSWRRQN